MDLNLEGDQRTQAECLAECLHYGTVDVATAVQWADSQIAASEVPDVVLCDVAMASREHGVDVASMLRRLPGTFDERAVLRCLVASILAALDSKRLSLPQVASVLYQLASTSQLPAGLRGCWWFFDALDLAADGYIQESPDEIASNLRSVLQGWLAVPPES